MLAVPLLVISVVDDALWYDWSRVNKTLLQLAGVSDGCLSHTLFNQSQNIVVNRVKIWTVRRPQIWRDERRFLLWRNCFTCAMCRCDVSPAIHSSRCEQKLTHRDTIFQGCFSRHTVQTAMTNKAPGLLAVRTTYNEATYMRVNASYGHKYQSQIKSNHSLTALSNANVKSKVSCSWLTVYT